MTISVHGTVRGMHVGVTGVTRVYVRVRGTDESVPDSVIYIDGPVDANVGDDATFVIGAAKVAVPQGDQK